MKVPHVIGPLGRAIEIEGPCSSTKLLWSATEYTSEKATTFFVFVLLSKGEQRIRMLPCPVEAHKESIIPLKAVPYIFQHFRYTI